MKLRVFLGILKGLQVDTFSAQVTLKNVGDVTGAFSDVQGTKWSYSNAVSRRGKVKV